MDNTCDNSDNKCSEVLSWKSPMVTAGFLLVLNLKYLIMFKWMEMTLLQLVSYFFLFTVIIGIIKKKLTGECCENNNCFKKENVEKTYTYTYDRVNLAFDGLRKIILLQNNKGLVKLVITLLFFITVGNWFTTLDLLILIFDGYIVFSFVSETEEYKTYRTKLSEFTKDQIAYVSSRIPKYKEN